VAFFYFDKFFSKGDYFIQKGGILQKRKRFREDNCQIHMIELEKGEKSLKKYTDSTPHRRVKSV